jgi:hypothetical protein
MRLPARRNLPPILVPITFAKTKKRIRAKSPHLFPSQHIKRLITRIRTMNSPSLVPFVEAGEIAAEVGVGGIYGPHPNCQEAV